MRLFKEQFLPCDRGHSSLKSCCRPNKERVFAVKQYPAGVSKMADFPRGGASTLSPLEVQRIKDSAMQDVLFGKTTEKVKKKEKQKKKVPVSKKDENVLTEKSLKSADSLSYKKLTEGMRILGCIREIQLTELVVSLPNSLNGYVPITSVHDVLTEQLQKSFNQNGDEDDEEAVDNKFSTDLHNLFHVGQFIPTVVKHMDSKKHGYKKIGLSLDPKDLHANLKIDWIVEGMCLWGFVSSIEDHGCIISFGVKEFSGFVMDEEKGSFKLGSTQWFLVKKISGRVIAVSANEDEINEAKCKEDDNLAFNALHPGALVNTTITEVLSDGVAVAFNGFQGIIDTLHLPNHGAGSKIKEKKKLLCRIIHVNPTSKMIGLSATNEITSESSNRNADSLIGSIQQCVVLKTGCASGLLVELEDGNKAFVHISRISDARVEKLGKKYKAGSSHRCRIVGYNGLDGLFVVSLEKSVIEQPFLRYTDIKPGMVVSGTILTLEEFGMIVKLSDHIKGLCPRIHLADIILKHPEKKLTDGKKVQCRVLSVNPEKKRLKLTHKKTLVDSDLPIITDYASITRGMELHGYIDRLGTYGLIVCFYNGVKGLAPMNQLRLQEHENINQVFYVGQVLKCRVLHCNPVERKLKLTLKSFEELEAIARSKENKPVAPNLFDVVDGDVTDVKDDGVSVQLPNGLKAFLKVGHLSDFKCNQDGLMFIYQAASDGQKRVKDLVYLGEQRRRHIVSNKRLLKLNAAKNGFITDFDQLKVGTQSVGVVHHIMQYGIFVEFAPGIVGLAPNSNIADYFVTNPSTLFYVGQTVLGKVLEIDQERRRFLVTLKPAQVTMADHKELHDAVKAPSLLQSMLEEREEIFNGIAKLPDGPVQKLAGMMGTIVQAKVVSVRQEGVRLQTDAGSNGFIPDELRKGIDVETGDVINCLVIDINTKEWLFIGTLIPEVIAIVETGKKAKQKLKLGSDVDVIVQRILPEYVIAAIPSHAAPIAFVVAKEHLNDIRDVTKRFFVGQKLKATVRSLTASGPVLECEDSVVDGQPVLGSMVTATVKSIKAAQVNVSVRNTKLHGRLYISEIWDEIKEGVCPLDDFNNGESLRCKLIGFRDVKTNNYLPITHQHTSKAFAELSCRPSIINSTSEVSLGEPKDLSDFKEGEKVSCYVKAVSENFLTVFVNQKVNGRISVLHSSTDKRILKHFTSHFKHGAAYNATVLNVDEENSRLELSLVGNIMDKVKKNGIVCGKIAKILPRRGMLIELPSHKCGFAHVTELYDEYKENPLGDFKIKTFVKCCILSINDDDQIDLTLRPSRASPEESANINVKDRAIHSMDDLHENDIVRGYVKSSSSCGVFVSLSSKIIGRVQIKNLSKYFVKNWQELFHVGKLVKAKILSINPSTNQIELSLRGPDVKDKDPAPPPKKRQRTESEQSDSQTKRERKDSTGLQIELRSNESDDDELDLLHKDDSDDQSDEENAEVETAKMPAKDSLPRLSLSGGFNWTEIEEGEQRKRKADSESESDEEENKATSSKKTKRQKRAEKKAEEEYLYQTELALLDKDRGPESAEDFDRLLLGSPNSSMLWIQYMAFYLHSAEIDKARAVAERALKTISFREENEKLNVWIASLNLECLYGTDETIQNTFNEAVKRNEPKKVYLKMTDIYIRNGKLEKAEKLFQTMTKRFNTSKKVWINYGFFLMKNGKTEAGRKLLQRSFQSLPERKHINTILKFALMEFKFGEAEKGVTMFESVLKNHPKRTDIWSVYIDVLIKNNEFEQVRNTFEKIITLNLSTKKMKFIFKRYLEFEKKYGDDKHTEGVKRKAMEYVESKTALD